jgi:YVTN family beta-propeller protein
MTSSSFHLPSRRDLVIGGAGAVAAAALRDGAWAQPAAAGPQPGDRVFLTNEDSNTLSVIDPVKDEIQTTINLTSFDEDARPPFRFVTGGVVPVQDERNAL